MTRRDLLKRVWGLGGAVALSPLLDLAEILQPPERYRPVWLDESFVLRISDSPTYYFGFSGFQSPIIYGFPTVAEDELMRLKWWSPPPTAVRLSRALFPLSATS